MHLFYGTAFDVFKLFGRKRDYWKLINLKKALEESKVKLKANDVVASYKIMNGIILFPIIYLIHTLLFLAFCYFHT